MKRKSSLQGPEQDAVFVLSVIGAIDLVKELAIISEGLADRPRVAPRESAPTILAPTQSRNGTLPPDNKLHVRDSDFPA